MLLNFLTPPAKGETTTVTLDKAYLLAMQAVTVSDEYYADAQNIKSVTVVYESEPGKQKYVLNFDFSLESPTAELVLPAQARNNIFFKTLVLHDFENDKLKLSREQIVLSDESIALLDICFGPMEDTNEIVVVPSEEGQNLYEEFAAFFMEKSGGTMTGALTLASAPMANLHAATKKYVDDAKEEALDSVQTEMVSRNSADTALSDRLDVLEADPVTKTYVDGEVSRATAAEADLAADLAAEISRAQAAEAAEQASRVAAVSAEQSRAQAAEASLSSAITAMVPAGTILPYGGAVAPSGYLMCDGSQLSKTAYSTLYSAIGESFGLGSNNKFKLPDLRGVFLRGTSGGSGMDPDALSRYSWNDKIYTSAYGAVDTSAAISINANTITIMKNAESQSKMVLFHNLGVSLFDFSDPTKISAPSFTTATFAPYTGSYVPKSGVYADQLGKYIVVGNKGTSASSIYYSADGTVWSAATVPAAGTQLSGVAWSAELQKLVAVSGSAADARAYISSDGITWLAQNTGIATAMNDIVWAKSPNCFIAVGNQASMKSSDGLTWESVGVPSGGLNDNWTSIAWSEEFKIGIALGATHAISLSANPMFLAGVTVGYNLGQWGSLTEGNTTVLSGSSSYKKIMWSSTHSGFIAYNASQAKTAVSRMGLANTWTENGSLSGGNHIALSSIGDYDNALIFSGNTPTRFWRYMVIHQAELYGPYAAGTGSFQSHTFATHNHGGGSHTHTVNAHFHGGGNHVHNYTQPINGSRVQGGTDNGTYYDQNWTTGATTTPYGYNTSAGGNPIVSESPGTSGPSTPISYDGGNETRPINVNVNYIIKY